MRPILATPFITKLDESHLNFGLAPNLKILKAKDYMAFQGLLESQKQADQTVQEAKEEAKNVLATAKQDGFKDGQELARKELLERFVSLNLAFQDWALKNEDKMVSIIMSCLHEFVETLPAQEMIRQSLQKHLIQMAQANNLCIKVHPSLYDVVEEEVSSLSKINRLTSKILIEKDEGLLPGDCVLETHLGVLDLRYETRLKQIESALLGDRL